MSIHQQPRTIFSLAVGAAMACVPMAAALAAHPLVTEDTGTQGRGKFQVEAQFERARDNEAGVTEESLGFAAVVSYGFHERADVIFTLPYERIEADDGSGTTTTASGRGDVALDIKWRFFEHERLSLALKSGVAFPTGDEQQGLGSGKRNVSALLIGSVDLEPVELHVTAGYIGNRNIADEKTRLRHLSVGGWVNIGDFKLVADIGRSTTADRSLESYSEFGILGVIYSPTDDLDLDVGVKWGLSDPETDRAVLAGVTLRY